MGKLIRNQFQTISFFILSILNVAVIHLIVGSPNFPMILCFFLFQSDVHYVGWTLLKNSSLGTTGAQGLLKQLVPGTPDCRPEPAGDGLIGVDGQNCPFQMYSLSGAFKIVDGGSYKFCLESTDGSASLL